MADCFFSATATNETGTAREFCPASKLFISPGVKVGSVEEGIRFLDLYAGELSREAGDEAYSVIVRCQGFLESGESGEARKLLASRNIIVVSGC